MKSLPVSIASLHLLAAAALFGLLAAGAAHAAEPARPFEVESFRDVPYWKAPEADPVRHTLDVFVPKGQKDFPVVLLVHGGAWMMGDKSSFGQYTAVGKFLASQGVGAVLPNYRLSPKVQHPEHVKDVARAFAWTHANIAAYGGRPDQLFLAGHSAGGHLVALLATDESYLKAEGLKLSDIRGVLAFSGVYHIPSADEPGPSPGLPLKPPPLPADFGPPLLRMRRALIQERMAERAMTINLGLYTPAFGTDPKVRRDASPLTHVHKGLPPFLIFYGDDDLPTLPEMAEEFYKALRDNGCEVEVLKVKDRSHTALLFDATSADDPVARAMLAFLRGHSK